MRENLRLVIELERLDEGLRTLEREGAELPARRATLEEGRQAAQVRLEEAREEIGSAERRQRELEAELQDAETQLRRLSDQQYEVTSREAYDALLREIGGMRGSVSAHETEILELMDRVEAGRRSLGALESQARDVELGVERELRGLEARAERIAKETARLRSARSELAARLDGELLDRYERIAARRRPAAVVVTAEVCSGCRVGIPSQRYLELLAGRSLVACGSCQRILVHERVLAS